MTSSFLVGDLSLRDPGGPGPAPTRSDALPPGTRLDEYEIGPLIGESPLGLVYLATDTSLGRKVAIREYLPSALSGRGDGPIVALRSAGMAEAFRRGLRAFVEEARLLARFDDPSLLRVLRFWEAHFTAYIVMPYYDAPTLTVARERLECPPGERWIRSLIESLANALELLHGESCLHRNLTPERVLMLRDGRPLLLGPSAVRQVLGRDAHTTLIQPGFSAIEEYAESSDLPQGPWTDVYALGALARFCILGIAPVAAPVRSVRDPLIPMHEALFPLRQTWPELDYSPALLGAIDRALAVDPSRRPQTMAEFRALLQPAQPAPAVDTPPRPEPQMHLMSATDLETQDFEAGLSAMLHAALVDAPPMRGASPPPPAEATIERAGKAAAATPAEPALDVDAPIPPAFADHLDALDRDRGAFQPSGRPGWQRRLTAAMAVAVLAAFGYVGWTQFQRMQIADQVANTSASEVAAPSPSASPDPIAEARRNPPAAGGASAVATPAVESPPAAAVEASAASATSEAPRAVVEPAPQASAATPLEPTSPASATSASTDPSAEAKPARTARLDRAAQREARAERKAAEPREPREVCGTRTEFALYRCMQTQCEKPQYSGGAQCQVFRLENRP